jgi:NADH dehydrogenase
VSWNELYERIARTLGKRRRRLHVPVSVARVGAAMVEHLPSPPLTRDQLTMLEAGDNVGDTTAAREAFRIEPIPLDEQLRRAA